MDKAYLKKKMEKYMMVIGKTINLMDMEFIKLRIMIFMKDIGLMEWNKEKERKIGAIKTNIKVNGIRIYNMELVFYKNQMEINMKVSFIMVEFKELAFFKM